MANGAQRFDVEIQLQNEAKTFSTGQIKAGDRVYIVKEDGRCKVLTARAGEMLGFIREEDFCFGQYNDQEVEGTVRSLRWDAGTGNLSSVVIRFSKAKAAPPVVGWVPPQTAHDVEDNEAAPLEQSRLLSMVNDPEVRRFLRDERLQDILHSIDGADDREATLARYLESPEFQEFSNMLLTKIGDV